MITDGVRTSYWFYKMAAIASQIYFRFLIWLRLNIWEDPGLSAYQISTGCRDNYAVSLTFDLLTGKPNPHNYEPKCISYNQKWVKFPSLVFEMTFTRFSDHCLLWHWPLIFWPQIWSRHLWAQIRLWPKLVFEYCSFVLIQTCSVTIHDMCSQQIGYI